jgi:hypothetical protein
LIISIGMAKASKKPSLKMKKLESNVKEVKKEKEEDLTLEEEVEDYNSPSELSSSRGLRANVLESGEVQEGPAEVDIRTPGGENVSARKVYGSGTDTSNLYGIQGSQEERTGYASSTGATMSTGGLRVDISRTFGTTEGHSGIEHHQINQPGLHSDDFDDSKNKKYDPVHDKKAKRYAWEV